ncbi:MAG: hypothetical protein ACYSWO_25190 [Planctomycetota bacterium]|jgi:hypothetical protein
MTKAELLVLLAGKFVSVSDPENISSDRELAEGYNHYLVGAWVNTGADSTVRRNVNFYVFDEGGAQEAAYWQGGDPAPEVVIPFSVQLQAFIDLKISDGTIESAFLTQQAENQAEASVWVNNSGTLEKRTVLFDKDGNGDIRYRTLGGAA